MIADWPAAINVRSSLWYLMGWKEDLIGVLELALDQYK
jgi:hypothetical protein